MSSNVEPCGANSVRILIVDDSATIRSSLKKDLESRGFCVLACNDGYDALSQVCDFDPSLIFTDISMPRVDGYEFITMLRSNNRFEKIPVIMLSSKSGVFDVARGHLIGCNDYLTKPIPVRSVDAIIDKYIRLEMS